MTKRDWVILSVGIIVIAVIIIALVAVRSCSQRPTESQRVEINSTQGTLVFIKLPGEQEQHLGNVPITVDVPFVAIIILRYKDKERVFTHDQWKNGKITHEFDTSKPVTSVTSFVSVSINAVPWAEVYIKPPGTDEFVKPGTKYFKITPDANGKDAHVTPIRGKMKVPAGTEIKLVYDGQEQIFPYESWKTRHSISHDFLGQ